MATPVTNSSAMDKITNAFNACMVIHMEGLRAYSDEAFARVEKQLRAMEARISELDRKVNECAKNKDTAKITAKISSLHESVSAIKLKMQEEKKSLANVRVRDDGPGKNLFNTELEIDCD